MASRPARARARLGLGARASRPIMARATLGLGLVGLLGLGLVGVVNFSGLRLGLGLH